MISRKSKRKLLNSSDKTREDKLINAPIQQLFQEQQPHIVRNLTHVNVSYAGVGSYTFSSPSYEDGLHADIGESSSQINPSCAMLNLIPVDVSYGDVSLDGAHFYEPSLIPSAALPTNVSSGVTKNVHRKKKLRSNLTDISQVPIEPHIFVLAKDCSYCGAKRFPRETPGFCCSNGQIQLAFHRPSPALMDLFTGLTPLAKEFKTFVRTYNNTFAFTSIGVRCNQDLCRRNNGVYTFTVIGQMYHNMNSLLPAGGNPSNLQLYIYDTEHEIDNRLLASDHMNPLLVIAILQILESNPYCQFFRSLRSLPTLKECSVVIKKTPSLDQRVYNAPTCSQVAAIWVEEGDASVASRDIVVFSKPGLPIRIRYFYGCYDSLQYPLLFPLGQPGWHSGIKRNTFERSTHVQPESLPELITASNIDQFLESEDRGMHGGLSKRDMVSCREYYCFLLQIRPSVSSILLHAGRLLQQYVVDMYIKLETSRLDYFACNQKRIRADLYSGIVDSIAIGETQGFRIGKRIVLPATFIGGPRDMRKRYLDAMTIVQRYGKPDFFITMTCNPNWPEIKRELIPGEEAQNRPDLLSRVFRAKVEELKNELIKRSIFGPIVAYCYVIEFQKRGLPHMHMLLILENANKIRSPHQFDYFVSAEIPSQNENPHLHRLVKKHMMHGPCGDLNIKNKCMKKDGQCRSKYPKEFCEYTSQTENSYPLYRRRNDGNNILVRKHMLNNQWVVPHNPYLLAKYNCHLNVEVCSTVKAVKYLYKYIYKGHDRVIFTVTDDAQTEDINEIVNFREGRWVGPPEAMWRIFKFVMNEVHPSVLVLQLHLENNHSVVYTDQADLHNIVDSPLSGKTSLTEYFATNVIDSEAQKLLYKQFPEHYVWFPTKKTWQRRKKGFAVGRVVSVSPIEGERYYLKVLLSHIRGAVSFTDLKQFQGVSCNTFREAAIMHGLIEEDECFRNAMSEACIYQMPHSLRRLFATLLAQCNPVNARSLWEEFNSNMCEDFANKTGVTQAMAITMCLRDLSYKLESMGKNINEYMLIDDQIIIQEVDKGSKEIEEELGIQILQSDIHNASLLNTEQKAAYTDILNCVFSSQHGAFFVDGPGGSGKTFLYSALLAAVRCKGFIALATASSGVAASVLSGGRTAHSRFKIPVDTTDQMTCNISKQSGLAKLLQLSKLIIWDEAPMIRRQAIESFERMLRDICECDQPFGGKVVVFGGDFRQVLPVVPKGSVEETIAASLVRSPLWSLLRKIRLTVNMRAQFDNNFSNFLLRVGEATVETFGDGQIIIPDSMIIPYNIVNSRDILINRVFPDLGLYSHSIDSVINRAILSTKNEFVDDINDTIINRFPGEFIQYRSFDVAIETSQQGLQEDFFNCMTPSGFPPHLLKLKINCPIMLLRNIDPSKGLCNGTRLICKSFDRNIIGATIATGTNRGKHVFLPRIPLTPPTSEIKAFPFQRTQFPIRLCFCMTINKAQGQTLDFVGIYLPQPVFSHGQLYVALSRAKKASSIIMLVFPTNQIVVLPVLTRNVVYKEILSLAAMD